MLAERFDRRLQVVGGKGGVGRTAVSCALALRAARAGKRTLLLEVDAPDSAAAFLRVPPAVDEPRQVADDLWLCRMTPVGAMREYALMVLKFKALYNLVFENRMVKYLLRSIPSLGEFTMLGKTWFHTTEKLADDSPKYERVIVDAPATGHAITYLSVARIVADIAPKGIMKNAAERMAQLVESKEETCLHLVALPEEMPVNEALDLQAAAQRKLRMAPGVGIMNRMLPHLATAEEAALIERLRAAGPSQATAPYLRAAKLRLDKEALQAEYAAKLAEKSGLPVIELPDYEALEQAEWLDRMIEEIERAMKKEMRRSG
jgi:anion-transporting  ArsA/GET3 family ATPase